LIERKELWQCRHDPALAKFFDNGQQISGALRATTVYIKRGWPLAAYIRTFDPDDIAVKVVGAGVGLSWPAINVFRI
jgi:predicted enzyme related to lactoylglutathione lyase